ncbi:MAG: hypothetical protein KDB24_18040 [Microthrixaceae bacterium]|nr:hypothetical protein [Microthrixaceae bacterium]
MKRVNVVATIGVAALMLGACGNDVSTTGEAGGGSGGGQDRSAEEQAYVDEVTAAFEQSPESEEFPVDQLECWVGDMVDGVGVDRLEEVGISAETLAEGSSDADLASLNDDERKVVADSFTGCIDLEQIFTQSMAAEGEEVPQEMKDCFAAIDWDAIEAEFGELILSGEENADDSAAMAPLMGCMMAGLGGAMEGELGDLDGFDTDSGGSVSDG